jgi:mRNA-degrading endonuclease RelE of RelBE toxin-antitoxin system
MVIVETRVFTKRIRELLDDETYRALQLHLVLHPSAGTVIPAGGGLRKVRWGGFGRGKRGGVRILYYRNSATDRLLMLFAFAKNERADLTPEQKRRLRQLIESEFP